jgi:hypothetical protein
MSAGMLYVYLLPAKLANGYCFGGGRPISFLNVDWMNTPPEQMTREQVEAFIRVKDYVKRAQANDQFLVLCTDRPDCTFTFRKEGGE